MVAYPYQAAVDRMIREHLIGRGIRSLKVLSAMQKVPREQFVSADQAEEAYADRALQIDCDQTISQPYIVALMTEALELTPACHVLEVGTGSGYQTAVLAELAGDVVSVERHEALSAKAATVLDQLRYRNVRLVVGDGTGGWPEAAPYDRIIVTAAAERCPPALFAQLREGGKLVIPLGDAMSQTLQLIEKTNGRATQTPLTACRFVPLVGSEEPRI